MIAIIDYGVGNVRAIANMLKKLGIPSIITSDGDEIKRSSKIILPGVGSYDTAIKELHKRNLRGILEEKVLNEKVPLLGICLGMQLLTEGSDEGKEKGFGWIPGYTYKLPQHSGLKVPHMMWNTVSVSNACLLTNELENDSRFYFLHSYYVKTETPAHVVMQTNYGVTFDSAIKKDNIMGVQFHPERSHKFGLKLLYNFTNL